MDTRYTDLRAVCDYTGVTDEERHHGLMLLEASATVAYQYATLLRGALADRFNLLADVKMAQNRGLKEGATLFIKLLNDQKGQGLTNDDVARGLLAVTKKGLTCTALLAMYLQTRRYLETQRQAA